MSLCMDYNSESAKILRKLDLVVCKKKILPVYFEDLDDWLTVHRSITLADFQLDAQNSYLFTYNIFINP